jgi:hypothetical protein
MGYDSFFGACVLKCMKFVGWVDICTSFPPVAVVISHGQAVATTGKGLWSNPSSSSLGSATIWENTKLQGFSLRDQVSSWCRT